MGTGKKEATRRERQGKTGDGMSNVRVKGENFYRYVSESARPQQDELTIPQRCQEGQEA